jgi:tetratricopeptide (TPR) repeat protein
MSTRIFSSSLILFLSYLFVPCAMSAQDSDGAAQLARIDRHQSSEWLTVEPHLPNPATASAAQLELAGDILRARRFPEDAVEFYIYALKRGGQEAALMNKLGVTELELRNVVAARVYFQRVVQLQRKDARGWNNLGAVEYSEGRYGKAISDYGRAIKLDTQQATYHSNRGTAYFETKDYERARREFDTALKLDPQMMKHLGTTGLEVHMLSPSDRARYCFELARLFAHRGDEMEMLHYLQMASEGGFDVEHDMGSDEVLARYRKDPRVLTLVRNAKALRSGRASADVPGGLPPLPPETHP